MIYAREYLAEVWGDLSVLPSANLAEVGQSPFLELDEEAYRMLEGVEALRVYTARRDGELVGYASFILATTNLHHKGLKYANSDALYVRPDCRGLTGKRLVDYAERDLRTEGVKLITLTVPLANDWSALAAHWGYESTEIQMRKWIG